MNCEEDGKTISKKQLERLVGKDFDKQLATKIIDSLYQLALITYTQILETKQENE